MLASSESDLQQLGLAAARNIAEMKINTSEFKVFHLSRNPVHCFLKVGKVFSKQVEEFNYFSVTFISDGRQDEKLDVRLGKASAVMQT